MQGQYATTGHLQTWTSLDLTLHIVNVCLEHHIKYVETFLNSVITLVFHLHPK